MTHHLGYEKHDSSGKNTGNSRNGTTSKTLKTGNGDIKVEVPRDRTSTFQTCIVHMVRHSLNYVPYNEKKAVAADLKKIYSSSTVELAIQALDDFELTWGG